MGYDLVSIVYGSAGVYTLFRLTKQRRSFFDSIVTSEDIQLAWMVAVFLLTPFGVLIHEAGHFLMADVHGATNIELHHRGYWGFVIYESGPSLGDREQTMVSAAGPLVSIILGYICLSCPSWLPVRHIYRHTLGMFGMITVIHTLIGYPLIDFTSGIEGDFHNIYTLVPLQWKIVSALIHGILIAVLVFSWKRVSNQLNSVGPPNDRIFFPNKHDLTKN